MNMDEFIKTTIKNAMETAFLPETTEKESNAIIDGLHNLLKTLREQQAITLDESFTYLEYQLQITEALS